jgi:hypothetical protein
MSATEWKFVPAESDENMATAFFDRVTVTSRGGLIGIRSALNAAIAAAPVPPSVESLLENWTPSDQQAFAKFRDERFPGEMSSYAIQSLGSAWKDGQANAMPPAEKNICRNDGRCEYAIQSGAEVEGHCPNGKCAMPQPAAHLTIPCVLEWDGPGQVTGDLARVYDVIGLHHSHPVSVLLVNFENIKRFSDYLEAVEREFFMVPGEPSDEPEDAGAPIDDECLLSKFPARSVEHYVEQFREALAVKFGDNGTHGADGESRAHGEYSEIERLTSEVSYFTGLTKQLLANALERNADSDTLRAQLANTEQSRRSFFDLSQDLEKRLAERDARLEELEQSEAESGIATKLINKWVNDHCQPIPWDKCIEIIAIITKMSDEEKRRLLDLGDDAPQDSVEPAKPKTCIECDQPYCHGVCVERGDQDYDRDQAAKGGNQ